MSNQSKNAVFGKSINQINSTSTRAMSGSIGWGLAKEWIAQHSNNTAKRIEAVDCFGDVANCFGFRINASELQNLVSRIVSPQGGPLAHRDVAEVILMPAQNPNSDTFTLILAAVDQQGNILTDNVLDYSDPCPPHCPGAVGTFQTKFLGETGPPTTFEAEFNQDGQPSHQIHMCKEK